jgi:F0F1-type ATP synthase assembly protein I
VLSIFVPGRRLACISVCGLIGILALMIPFHYAVWYPLYAHEHVSSTQSLAFIVIPFLCLITLVIGGLVGWAVSFIPFLRTYPPPLQSVSPP